MKTRTVRIRLAAPAAVLSALLLVTACGSDDTDPDPDPTSTSEQGDDDTGLSESDLEDALLTEDDVSDLSSDIEEVDVEKSDLSSDDMVDGDEACATFLDEEYGAEEEEKAATQFDGSDVSVYSTVELYAAGEAEEELEAVRDLFADCTTFTLDLDGAEVAVDVMTIELDELDGYDLGDEGIAIDMTFTQGGSEILRQGYTLIRIDDVLTISAASTQGTLGDDIMLTITEAAADNLQAVLDDAA